MTNEAKAIEKIKTAKERLKNVKCGFLGVGVISSRILQEALDILETSAEQILPPALQEHVFLKNHLFFEKTPAHAQGKLFGLYQT